MCGGIRVRTRCVCERVKESRLDMVDGLVFPIGGPEIDRARCNRVDPHPFRDRTTGVLAPLVHQIPRNSSWHDDLLQGLFEIRMIAQGFDKGVFVLFAFNKK